MVKERDFKRRKLPRKFMTRMLYRWNDRKFEKEYLRMLEKNQNRWKNDKRECEEEERKKDTNEYMKELEGIVWN